MTDFDRFTCEEMFARIDDFVDRELSAEDMERAHRHLETCVYCASEFDFQASMLRNLKAKLRRIDVPADLLSRISAQLERERPDPDSVQ